MKKSILICGAILFAFQFGSASAKCVGSVINGKCHGTEVYGSDDNSGYTGSSGTRYQYDLSKPVDRSSYSIDLDAQRRDQMNLDPGRSMDRGMGQYGGGIYDN